MQNQGSTKFCKHCGQQIPAAAVICSHCGCQVENIQQSAQPNIVINNANNNTNTNVVGARGGKRLSKWTAFFLCLFLGFFGAHKFYEGKNVMGVIYLFTFGLAGFGWFIDLIALLFKPNPYYI